MTLYEAPDPHLIIKPKTKLALVAHRQATLNNLVYFFWYVLGNGIKACLNYILCKDKSHFHGAWCRNYELEKFVYACSSRRMIKSTFSQGVAAREGVKRKLTIVVGMNSSSQVKIWMDLFYDVMDHVIQNLGLDIKVIQKSEKKGIKLSNGTTIYPRSLEGKYRGLNPDLIIIDDLLDKVMKMSFLKAESRFRADIMGSRVKTTRIIYIGTIIQDGDITYKITKGEIGHGLFVGDKYPAIPPSHQQIFRDFMEELIKKELLIPLVKGEQTEEINNLVIPDIPVLWPEVRDLLYLIEQYSIVGDVEFEIEFLLNLIMSKMALVPAWMIERAKDTSLKLGRDRLPNSQAVSGVDLQISISAKADWTVIFDLEIVDNEIRVLDMERFQGAELETDGLRGEVEDYIIVKIGEHYIRYNLELILIEKNTFQRVIANTMRKEFENYPIEDHNTGSNKHETDVGIPSIKTLFRNNEVKLAWGDRNSREKMGLFLHELNGMQYDQVLRQYVSKTRTKDIVIAFWIATIAAREIQGSDARMVAVD